MISVWAIPNSIIDQFFSNHVSLSYRKGQIVFPQGSPADVLYLLQRGMVEIHRAGRDGNRFILRLAGPGDLIGFADLTDENGESIQAFGARARTNCEIVLVTREHAVKVLEGLTPERAARLIAALNHSWSVEVARLSDFLLGGCRERLKALLIELAQRFGARDERGIVLVPDLTHQDLSDLVGFSRAMTSKAINELIHDGAIAYSDGHYIVPRGSELSAALGPSAESAGGRTQTTARRIAKSANRNVKMGQTVLPVLSSTSLRTDQTFTRRN